MAADTLIRELFLQKRPLALLMWRLPHDLRRYLFRQFFKDKAKTYETRLRQSRTPLPVDAIFVHIPKTAGMSVAHALYGSGKACHLTILHYQILFSKEIFNASYKFAFVRNPWDRMVSSYTFLMSGGYTENDKAFARNTLAQYASFKDFVKGWIKPGNMASRIHFLPQYYYVYDPFGRLQVDYIGHFESINEDFAYVAQKAGVGNVLEHRNATKDRNKDYRSYYDDETIEIIAKYYERDIALFQYSF